MKIRWEACASQEACGGNSHWSSIYVTTAPAGITALNAFTSNLYQGEDMLHLAQEPDPPDPFFMDDHYYYHLVSGSLTSTTATDPWFSDLGGSGLVGSYVFVWRQANEVDFRQITAYSDNQITFDELGDAPYDDPDRYLLAVANNLQDSVLNLAGEYYFDESTREIYLWLLGGADPNDVEVTISVRSPGFDVGAHNTITIEGLKIQKGIGGNGVGAAVIAGDGSQGLIVRSNEIVSWRSQNVYNVTWIWGMGSALFEGNFLSLNVRLRGLDVTGDNIIIRNNTFFKVGRTPIGYMNGAHGQIVGNTITQCRGVHSNGISPYAGSDDVLISGNRVLNSNIPLTFQDCTNVTVVNNIFDGGDSAAIAVWGGDAISNLTIEHNLLFGDWGAYYTQECGFSGLVIKNNIIEGMSCDGGPGSSITGDFAHNIYTVDYSPLAEGDLVQTNLDLLFVDPAGDDYHLRDGSPAIDAGVDVGVTEDIDHNPRPAGSAPDIGPYEHN